MGLFAALNAANCAKGEPGGLSQVLLEPAFLFTKFSNSVANLAFKPGHNQHRALDLASRNARKLESVPPAIMDEVLAKLAPIFE